MSYTNPCPAGGTAMSSSDCIAGGGQCLYPAIGVGGDVCCCQFPSPSPVGYVYANVQIFTNNVPSSVASQVGWKINISPSSCGSPVSGTGPQSGLKINIGNCTQVTLTIQATSVPSGVSCAPLTASATVNAGQTAVLALSCSPAPSPTPQQYWTLNVSVDDPYGAGYIITDNYGNSLQAARSLTTSFANYPSNVSSVTLNAKIQFNPSNMQCSISPSTVTVNAPSGGTGTVTQNFTVSCTQTSTSVSPYSVDVKLVNVDYGIGTPGSSTVCVTVTAKYSGTSVSGCISPDSEFADLGNIQLFYSPDILQIQGNYVYVAPSQVQVTTSDAGSTIYFGVYNMPSTTYPTGLWIVHPSKVTVYKGPVTVPNAYTLINLSNSPVTVSPTVILGTQSSGGLLWNTWGTATVSPSSVTIQPGRAVSFTVSADLTNAPYDRNAESYDYFVLTSPSVLNPLLSIAEHCVIAAGGEPCGVADYLEIWELPSTSIAFPQQASTLPSLTGVSSQDVSNITSYCTSQVSGGGAGVIYITYNNWMQQPLPICIVPQTTSESLTISTTSGFIAIPLSLSQAYVPGNYIPSLPGAQLSPSSGTPPVVVKPGIDVTVYLLYSIKHDCYYYGSYNVEVKYSVVGQQSGTVYASGDETLGPYDNSCDGAYEVYKLSFTMPNEPIVLTASVYATGPSESVIGMPSVFPLQLSSVTAQFVPMQCQPYDNYGSVATAVVMLPTTGVFQYLTDVKYWECTNPTCLASNGDVLFLPPSPSTVVNVPVGSTSSNIPSELSNYATCVTFVPKDKWSGAIFEWQNLETPPVLCSNAYITPVYAPEGVSWKLKSSCGGEVSGVGTPTATYNFKVVGVGVFTIQTATVEGFVGLPIYNGPPTSCTNPTITFEVDPTTLPPKCYTLVFRNATGSIQPSSATLTPTTPYKLTIDATTDIGSPCNSVTFTPGALYPEVAVASPGVSVGYPAEYSAAGDTFFVSLTEPLKLSVPVTAGCPQGTTLEDGASCGLSGNQCVSTPLGVPWKCCCAPKGANITIPSDMIIQVCPPGFAVPPTATNMVTADQANLALYCPSGGFVTTTDECANSGGKCTGTPTGENVPQYLLENLCCCQLPSAQVTCSSGTSLMLSSQCEAVYFGICVSYPPNMQGYCCCSIPSKPPGPGVTVPTTTPTTTPTATPTPTPTTPPTVTTCPSGTNLLPLGNCYMSNGTCVATPSGMSGVCCCKLPSPTVTPTPTPTVVTPTVTVPVGVPAVSPVPTAVTPTPTAVTRIPTPPKVSKAMIGVIAGLAALGLAGGVYFATRKKKP